MDGMETRAVWPVKLSYRQAGRTLSGAFPYGATAVISNVGTTRKERFLPGSFDYTLRDPAREVNLLSGHSYSQPLASRSEGTLKFEDTKEALKFEAELPVEGDQPSWIVDLIKSLRAGLAKGISPGFTVPPKAVRPNAERLVPEEGSGSAMVRELAEVVLYELSIVVRAAYKTTSVALRSDGLVVPDDDMERYYRWL